MNDHGEIFQILNRISISYQNTCQKLLNSREDVEKISADEFKDILSEFKKIKISSKDKQKKDINTVFKFLKQTNENINSIEFVGSEFFGTTLNEPNYNECGKTLTDYFKKIHDTFQKTSESMKKISQSFQSDDFEERKKEISSLKTYYDEYQKIYKKLIKKWHPFETDSEWIPVKMTEYINMLLHANLMFKFSVFVTEDSEDISENLAHIIQDLEKTPLYDLEPYLILKELTFVKKNNE